jgi:hypothetical protein
MVAIFDNICSKDGLWIYRWISSLVVTSMFFIMCFPTVFLNAKGMVGHPRLQVHYINE